MAWCHAWYHQPSSHYLSQCWPSSVSPYGVIRLQWVNACVLGKEHYYGCALDVMILHYRITKFAPNSQLVFKNGGHWPWPLRSFWPFWLRILRNSACRRNNSSVQGSHRVWKIWKNWKIKIFWKSHGKSWNFEKSSKVIEKSWNVENLTPINHPPALEIWHW